MSRDMDAYPIELDEAAIQRVLPHRGEILFIKRVTVLASNRYVGHAMWTRDLPRHALGMPGFSA
ncbi:hypothetical protein GALL_336800 [mine drainage metagenome]|uniref:Uncharacterized protein n=1 Tax=mine drainage metagenome TaxID=410659 RepID=A0A1J5QMD8_9ZZZZ